MRIPLVVVDDREEDRYLVKRRIRRYEDFDQLIEVSSGVDFLNLFFKQEDGQQAGSSQSTGSRAGVARPNDARLSGAEPNGARKSATQTNVAQTSGEQAISRQPLMVLMDINMPGLNGFDTIREVQRRFDQGENLQSVLFLMFSSSDNKLDKDKAEQLDMVKGYLTKPLCADSIDFIRQLYRDTFQRGEGS